MSPVFTTPFDALALADLERLAATGRAEADDLALVPPEDAAGAPAWGVDAASAGPFLRAVAALANAFGGHVVLGVETVADEEGRRRAAALAALPDAPARALMLERLALELLEPAVPGLAVRAIGPDATGRGAVVARVPPSSAAPHRLLLDNHCWIRRRTRDVAMTMAEIAALARAAGHRRAEIEARFEERRKAFYRTLQRDQVTSGLPVIGLRVTLLPGDGRFAVPALDRHHPAVGAGFDSFRLRRDGEAVDLVLPRLAREPRPVLRGVRFGDPRREPAMVQTVQADGLVELVYRYRAPRADDNLLPPAWPAGMLLNGALAAHRLCLHAGLPELEYGVEVEVSWSRGELLLGAFADAASAVGPLEPAPLLLPRGAFRSLDDVERLVGVTLADLWNAAGEDWPWRAVTVEGLDEHV